MPKHSILLTLTIELAKRREIKHSNQDTKQIQHTNNVPF